MTPLKRFDEIIYGLTSPDGQVRYIGRTTLPGDRFLAHRYAKTALGDWVRSVGATMVEIEFCEYPVVRAGKREFYWIEKYRAMGADLFNVAPIKSYIQDMAA
jgi:GIY-YIG catalytic domain